MSSVEKDFVRALTCALRNLTDGSATSFPVFEFLLLRALAGGSARTAGPLRGGACHRARPRRTASIPQPASRGPEQSCPRTHPPGGLRTRRTRARAVRQHRLQLPPARPAGARVPGARRPAHDVRRAPPAEPRAHLQGRAGARGRGPRRGVSARLPAPLPGAERARLPPARPPLRLPAPGDTRSARGQPEVTAGQGRGRAPARAKDPRGEGQGAGARRGGAQGAPRARARAAARAREGVQVSGECRPPCVGRTGP